MMFLICNDIPDIPSDDDGTWRRLTVINFPSKFIPRSEMTEENLNMSVLII